MLGIAGAGHKEANPKASACVISQLACSLVGEAQTVRIAPGSLVHRSYGKTTAVERFNCRYGLNETYRRELETGGIGISGVDDQNNVRVFELAHHRFFIATLFMPQLSSTPECPHPLIVSFLEAVDAFRKRIR